MTALFEVLRANLGWAATVVFTASYFCRRQEVLRVVQMAGAALWLSYGIANDARPVVVANAILLAVAGVTTLRDRLRASESRAGIATPGADNIAVPGVVPSQQVTAR